MCVWGYTFFGHSIFDVNNFLEFFPLPSALDSSFFMEGGLGTKFFSHSTFEVKKFSEFIPLPTALDSEFFIGGVQSLTFFWSCQI